MSRYTRCLVLSGWLLAACFSASETTPPQGGESHFLKACSGKCGDGLECVCGVCTRTCDTADECSAVGKSATCLASDGIGDTRSCEVGQRADARVCDERCLAASDCRAGFACVGGLCRQPVMMSSAAPAAGTSAGAGGSGAISMPTNQPAAPTHLQESAPMVMLLVDTSGSMEYLPNCTCTTLGCQECLPDCDAGQASRWHEVLASLTGSYSNFGCTKQLREADIGATYDLGYSIPHFALNAGTQQRADGVIDAYASRVRFGMATFDGNKTYGDDLILATDFDMSASEGPMGGFSYAGRNNGTVRVRPDGSGVGYIMYPACAAPYFEDWGIRSPLATDGALMLPAISETIASNSAKLKANLRKVRTFGGTPITAALDDLWYYFAEDPAGEPRIGSEHRYVVLVTDGIPDDDFRNFPSPGCACTTRVECGDKDPAEMRCPYPTSVAAAHQLRCGFDPVSCKGPIDKLYVVSYSASDTDTTHELGQLAAAGGNTELRVAHTQAELRDKLVSVLDEIVAAER